MTNYVIINGTNSNTITGLAINELPPITKPLMRTETEEIDGRDGDIITKLGYSAYDKTITIGLWGTGYDVNSIISFFNKEGTITFSNEADKYYNFTMLEQFDIESLLRFKTATLTFHCQPFKYPITETPIEIAYEYIEQDNVESATLNNTNGNTHLDISLKGNTSQTGTPTPDSPIPINVVSGDNEVVVCGTNIAYRELEGKFRAVSNNGAIQTNVDFNSYIASVNANTNYVAKSFEGEKNFSNLCFFDKDMTYLSGMAFTGSNAYRTFTTPNNCRYITIACYKTISEYMVVSGTDIPATFEPYTSQTYNITLPNGMELCKIGDYQDYFTKNSDGQWCKYNAIGKVVLDGTIGGYNSGNNWFYIGLSGLGIATTTNEALCDYFTFYENFTSLGNTTIGIGLSSALTNFLIRNTDLTSENAYKTWLGTNQPEIYYVLATPTDTEITDATLITQLDNIQNAMSYEGQTNVSQVNNDKPFIIDLIAMKDGTDEVVVNNIGNTYSKPTIALEGTGDINIYLDGTQMLKATLTDKMTIDTNNLEAYNPDTMTLLNRQLVGDISKFTLASGNNSIKVDGNLTKATITDYTRWL